MQRKDGESFGGSEKETNGQRTTFEVNWLHFAQTFEDRCFRYVREWYESEVTSKQKLGKSYLKSLFKLHKFFNLG